MKYYNLTWMLRHEPDAFLRREYGRFWYANKTLFERFTEVIEDALNKRLDEALLSGFDEWNAEQQKADMQRIVWGTLNGLPVRIWVK